MRVKQTQNSEIYNLKEHIDRLTCNININKRKEARTLFFKENTVLITNKIQKYIDMCKNDLSIEVMYTEYGHINKDTRPNIEQRVADSFDRVWYSTIKDKEKMTIDKIQELLNQGLDVQKIIKLAVCSEEESIEDVTNG